MPTTTQLLYQTQKNAFDYIESRLAAIKIWDTRNAKISIPHNSFCALKPQTVRTFWYSPVPSGLMVAGTKSCNLPVSPPADTSFGMQTPQFLHVNTTDLTGWNQHDCSMQRSNDSMWFIQFIHKGIPKVTVPLFQTWWIQLPVGHVIEGLVPESQSKQGEPERERERERAIESDRARTAPFQVAPYNIFTDT